MDYDYEVGDLVWAKMKGSPFWPAKVTETMAKVKRPSIKKPMQFVFFFGSKNYAWILEEFIRPYEEFKNEYSEKNQSGPFKAAVKAIIDYGKDHPQRDIPEKSKDSATNGIRVSPVQVNHAKVANFSPKKKVTKFKKVGSPLIKVAVKPASKRRLSETSSTSSSSYKTSRPDKYSALLTSITPTAPSWSVSANQSSPPYNSPTASSPSKTGLLTRPTVSTAVSPEFAVDCVSEILKQKNVQPSDLKFGFLGMGIMGRGIVKNLLNSKHKVSIWNRDSKKCEDFKKLDAVVCDTPSDVVANSDITFSCLSDPDAAKQIVFGNCGVLTAMTHGKGYVEITSIDPETSKDIAEAVNIRGGRYLEAPVSGSRVPAERGTLIILAAGDRELFGDCESCFQAIGKHAFYLGSEVGNGSKMNLVLHMVMGVAFASLAEAMAIAQRVGLSQKNLLEIIELGPLNCPAILEKGKAILENNYKINMALQHMQNDLHLALNLANKVNQSMPTTAAANEVFKHAKSLGYGEHDVSAVYHGIRF